MSHTEDELKAGMVLALPPIALSELKEPTKDYLRATAEAGQAPEEVMKELLDRGAGKKAQAGSPDPARGEGADERVSE